MTSVRFRLTHLAAWVCGRGDVAHGQDLLADVVELYGDRRADRGPLRAGARAAWDVITLVIRPAPPRSLPSARSPLMRSLTDEARQAWRAVRHRPLVSLSAALMLALGVALTLLTLTVVDGVLIRPLPFPGGHRLLAVYDEFRPESGLTFSRFALSWPEYLDYERQSQTVDLAAFAPAGFNLSADGTGVERVIGARTTSSAFALLGIAPALGRVLTAAEDQPGASCVAVLSHELWRDRFDSAAGAVGRTIRVNGQACEIVGVMPPRFEYPDERARIWLPLTIDRDPNIRGNHGIAAIGRVRDGSSYAAADAERATLMTQWAGADPHHKGHGIVIAPLAADLAGDLRLPLRVLGTAVLLVLLIIVANVSHLLLAHGESRRRELAVRQALGANRLRLVRQMMFEGLLLSAGGAALGVFVAWLSLGPLIAAYPGTLPRAASIMVDGRSIVMAVAVCAVVGLLVAAVPALRLTKKIATGTGELADRSGHAGLSVRTQRTLVAVELALSISVTVAALLLVQSFVRLQQTPLGFEPSGAIAVSVTAASGAGTAGQVTAFYTDLLARVRAEPGVGAAGAISSVPLAGAPPPDLVMIDGHPILPPSQSAAAATADYVMATPGVLEALGARVVRGRALALSDTAVDAPVAVINETMARLFWAGVDPIGRRVRYPDGVRDDQWTGFGPWVTIVGIVGDMRTIRPSDLPRPAIYVSHAQRPRPPYTGRAMGLVVRTSADAPNLLTSVRTIARELDPQSAVTLVRPLSSFADAAVARPRFMSGLMAVFAGVSLVVAVLGVYGLVAYAVARRTREIGVRIALGATRPRIARLVGAQLGLTVSAALPAGLAGAAGLSTWISSLLFGVAPFDAVTYVAVAGILALAVVAAIAVPVRRAMRVDPIIALRVE